MIWTDDWERAFLDARPRSDADSSACSDLLAAFRTAVDAARPALCLPPHLPAPASAGRTLIVGAGKGSGEMARVAEAHYADATIEGVVLTKHRHGYDSARLDICEGGHPIPDAAGLDGARRLAALLESAGADDLVVALVSGGGSALLSLPPDGADLADMQDLSRGLLASGAPIAEMNTVRRHVSPLCNGGLARLAAPARVVVLAISDVTGDDLSTISSGPFTPGRTAPEDALAVISRYAIPAAHAILAHLQRDVEAPPALDHVSTTLVTTPAQALAAAAALARRQGLAVHDLGDGIDGESRDVARGQAALALRIAAGEGPVAPPCLILSGGETTVTIRGTGTGGSNREFALALALALDGHPRIHALVADTDGTDGAGEVAGALVCPDTLARAAEMQLEPAAMLEGNDAGSFFAALGDELLTGPSLTNVNDFRAILVR